MHPIPVVFPLSTWAESRKPLEEWLVDELNLRYDVPRKISDAWVASDQVLPLLDGLDEVKSEHRAACVATINVFRQSHGLLPLIITSRMADYEALAKPLRLHGAILVQPLSREQVNAYLADLGLDGESVHAALREDSLLGTAGLPVVAERRDRSVYGPAGSAVAAEWYHGRTTRPPIRVVRKADAPARAAERRYTPEQTVHWLSWLAYQMANHGQTVFYLVQLQVDWLPQGQRQAIRVCNGLVVAMVVALVVALVGGLVGVLVVSLGVGWVGGWVGGLVGASSAGGSASGSAGWPSSWSAGWSSIIPSSMSPRQEPFPMNA